MVVAVYTPDWGDQYDLAMPRYKALADETHFMLRKAVEAAGIKTHSISSREKTRASFLEKIVRKGYEDPFAEMPDIAGVRVVVLFMDDLPKLAEIVRRELDVVNEVNWVEAGDADSFSYMSTHYECQLNQGSKGPRYDELKGLRVEVQCRTILMDAWANVSHHLDYKGEASIPEELRRDFHALSGLFYVADRHFQLFYTASREADEEAADIPRRETDLAERPLNRSTLRALLRAEYDDREHADAASISEFVEELAVVGYETIGSVQHALARARSLALEYEEQHPPADSENDRFADIGLARTAVAIADPKYAQTKYGARESSFAEYREQLS